MLLSAAKTSVRTFIRLSLRNWMAVFHKFKQGILAPWYYRTITHLVFKEATVNVNSSFVISRYVILAFHDWRQTHFFLPSPLQEQLRCFELSIVSYLCFFPFFFWTSFLKYLWTICSILAWMDGPRSASRWTIKREVRCLQLWCNFVGTYDIAATLE